MLLLTICIIIFFISVGIEKDLTVNITRTIFTTVFSIIYIAANCLYFNYLSKGVSLYGGTFICNTNSLVFNIFLLGVSTVIISLNCFYYQKQTFNVNELKLAIETKKPTIITNYKNDEITEANFTDVKESTNKTDQQYKIMEYPLIIIFVLCGAIFLMSSNDIISIFLSIELQSYGLYLLCSMYRNSEYSTKAGLTYFLLGGLSSCIILLALSLLYINSGNTNIENIYILKKIANCHYDLFKIQDIYYYMNYLYESYYINICLIILLVGFLFKVSAAPFHFWSPDVYDGIPTIVTTFVAIIAKISIFVFLLEIVHYTSINYTNFDWSNNLLTSCLLSLTIGSVLGLTQSRIKRLFAFSTISHIGFILLSLSINSSESIQAFIFYVMQYSISNLNAFIILISMGYIIFNYFTLNKEYNELRETENSPIQEISQIRGFFKINNILAISLGITLFSFLGVPPLLGFFGKQMVLSAGIDKGYMFMCLVAILTSVISAAYYLVVIKQIFFEDAVYYNGTSEKDTKRLYSVNNYNLSYGKEKYSVHPILPIKDNNDTNIQSVRLVLSTTISNVISILTLIIIIFMFTANENLNLIKLLSIYISNI